MNPSSNPISLIVAMGTGRVIGHQGEIPWRLPADLAHFKKTTLGQPIVMGRKTWESIGRPLPVRRNIVLSRSEMTAEGAECFTSVDEVLRSCTPEEGEVFIIGGGEIYSLFLSMAQKVHLTEVEGDFHGDAFFPELPAGDWQEVSRETRPADAKNPHTCHFLLLERI